MTKIIKKTMQRRRPNIKGICAAALTLGCNRNHLRWVVNGERHSPKLLARYQALQREKSQ